MRCGIRSRTAPRSRASARNSKETAIPKILDVAFEIRPPSADERLDGSGLVVVNPPFVFEKEMRVLLPELKKVLAEDRQARWSLDWLTGENAARLTATRSETIMCAA